MTHTGHVVNQKVCSSSPPRRSRSLLVPLVRQRCPVRLMYKMQLRSLLLLFCALFSGYGGIPLPCKQDTICLKHYNEDTVDRLTIGCRNLSVDLGKNGDFLDRNVSRNPDSNCITWKSGILLDCTVTETDHKGAKRNAAFTYNCTQAVDRLTAPTSPPVTPTLSAVRYSIVYTRHHMYNIPAVIVVFVFLTFHDHSHRIDLRGSPISGDNPAADVSSHE
ncbi:uncharacterized protein LOC142658563 [Rhinoderma darwinii]|uniref:uncharacterized protein LOC142658563 n=1 Tax=Rhinoderma darwinii TaxID=43563 RepID=UPI003F679F7D